MSDTTIVSKIVTAVKGVFGKATRPVVSSKPEDMEAAGVSSTSTRGEASKKEQGKPESPSVAATEPAKDGEEAGTTHTERSEEPAGAAASAESAPVDKPATETQAPVHDWNAASDLDTSEKTSLADELMAANQPTIATDSEVFKSAKQADASSGGELPVPNYSEVTIASMRARLRKLTMEQVRELRAYEAGNAERADFLKMFDNRIAKLEAEQAG